MSESTPVYYVSRISGMGTFFKVSEVVISKQTNFQKAEICISPVFGKCLMLDNILQISQNDEFIYHESMVHPTVVSAECPVKRVLILGGGDGCALREVLKHDVDNAVMVDIDGEVVNLSKEHLKDINLGSMDDPKAEIIIGDAVEYVKKAQDDENKRFDLILMDLVDATGEASYLGSEDFFTLCSNLLSQGGALVTHGNYDIDFAYVCELNKKLKNVFKHVRFHKSFIPSFFTEWGFLICSNSRDPASVTSEEAEKKMSGIELRHYVPKAHQSLFMLSENDRDMLENYERKYKKEGQKEIGKFMSLSLEE